MDEFMMKKLRQAGFGIQTKKSVKKSSKQIVKGAKSNVKKSFTKKSQDEAWNKAYDERYEEVAREVREDLDSGSYEISWGYNQSVDIELEYTYNGESYDRDDSLDIGDWGNPATVLNLDTSLDAFSFDIDGLVSEVADNEATSYADEHWQEYDDSDEEDDY